MNSPFRLGGGIHGKDRLQRNVLLKIDEMPSEARQAYEEMMRVFADKNQNGIPDVFEGVFTSQSGSLASQPTPKPGAGVSRSIGREEHEGIWSSW